MGAATAAGPAPADAIISATVMPAWFVWSSVSPGNANRAAASMTGASLTFSTAAVGALVSVSLVPQPSV